MGAGAEEVIKKRGRKPKGGKVVCGDDGDKPVAETCPSVILHLKCSMKEVNDRIEEIKGLGISSGSSTVHLVQNPSLKSASSSASAQQGDIMDNDDAPEYFDICNGPLQMAAADGLGKSSSTITDAADAAPPAQKEYHYTATLEQPFEYVTATTANATLNATANASASVPAPPQQHPTAHQTAPNLTHIQQKLKQLEHRLHVNQPGGNKPSACFWDTCFFDGSPVHIPMYQISGTYHVYGNFCCPRCAVAYLHAEHIDSSTKFERYALLQQIYGNLYEYKKPIQPAPNPHVLLDKFMGNLTIDEYRALMQTDKLFLTVNKPMTRVLPELVESHENHVLNTKIIPSSVQMLKYGGGVGGAGSGVGTGAGAGVGRRNQKAAVMNAKFGIVTAPEANA